MESGAGISHYIGFGLAWLFIVGWCSQRALRRGDGAWPVICKALFSLALAGGLVFFIRQKLDRLTGDFSGDAALVLMAVGAVAVGGVVLSALWVAELAELVAAPLANIFDGGSEPPESKPPPVVTEASAVAAPVFTTDETEPGRLAAACVEHLSQYPHDTAVREKLAVIYARHFKRLDLATLEFEQLLNDPRNSPKQTARWLKLLAKMQIELNAPVAVVEATLQRMMSQFPDDPESAAARQKLAQIHPAGEGHSRAGV